MGAGLLRAPGSGRQETSCSGSGFRLQVDSHPLSLLEGSGGVRREHLPGCLDEAEVTAGPCSHGCSGGVVKKLRRICVYTGQDCCKTQHFRLTRLLRNLHCALKLLVMQTLFRRSVQDDKQGRYRLEQTATLQLRKQSQPLRMTKRGGYPLSKQQ